MSALATRLYRGEEPMDALDPGDRGFAYGDGLFTTARVYRGGVVWWDAHRRRLADGAARLRIAAPAAAFLEREVDALLAGAPDDAVLKIVLTRGTGGRGYGPPAVAAPTLVLALHPLPPALPEGLALRWCDTRVASQPALAGIKHLNRLEQVLARGECDDAGVDEGLMLGADGDVVGATAANVFALVDGRWCTPPVRAAGIDGIARRWVLQQPVDNASGLKALPHERVLAPADVERADAVFLCNAVRGILPAGSLGDRRWAPHPALDALRRQLGRSEPAFR